MLSRLHGLIIAEAFAQITPAPAERAIHNTSRGSVGPCGRLVRAIVRLPALAPKGSATIVARHRPRLASAT
jgi:hypothetical protein